MRCADAISMLVKGKALCFRTKDYDGYTYELFRKKGRVVCVMLDNDGGFDIYDWYSVGIPDHLWENDEWEEYK